MEKYRISKQCFECQLKTFKDMAKNLSKSEKDKYLLEIDELFNNVEPDETTLELIYRIELLYPQYFPRRDYTAIKKKFNNLLLEQTEKVKGEIENSDNHLLMALKYSIIANYIDYTAKYKIDETQLFELLQGAKELVLNDEIFRRLEMELEKSRSLLYLTDNCGEIVMDKLVVEVLQKKYPNLDIIVMVRNETVTNNDATIVDAKQIGLDKICKVIDNGNCYGGTVERKLSKQAKEYFENSDVIISKGQGNVETLLGCGKNIFYMFLCKCPYFAQLFSSEVMKPVLYWEKESKIKKDEIK